MTYFLIALSVFVFLILLTAVASYALFHYACVRNEKEDAGKEPGAPWRDFAKELNDGAAWIAAHKTRTLQITSHDDLLLKAWFVPAENAKGTLIVMHGYRSLASVDYAPQAAWLHSLGYNLVIPMQRSHHESEGRYITFGVKESMDCKLWVHEVSQLFGKESDIFLCGISMGAATVMMASRYHLSKNVRGIIADCGFTSPWDVMVHVAKRDMHLPAFPLVYGARFFTKLLAKFDPKRESATDAMRTNKLPVLFIHGEEDTFVPTAMSRKNYDACVAQKELLIVPKAQHAQAYLVGKEAYQKAVSQFLSANASPTAQ